MITTRLYVCLLLVFCAALPLQAAPFQTKDEVKSLCASAIPDGAAIVFDITDGRVLFVAGEDRLQVKRPAGSLLKLFTSYALLRNAAKTDEVFYCAESSPDVPATQSCWYRPGHGNMTFSTALANSCNAWFRQWFQEKNPEAVHAWYASQNLLEESPEYTFADYAGFTPRLRLSVADLTRMCATLFGKGVVFSTHNLFEGRRCAPVAAEAIDKDAVQALKTAMKECADSGTASAVGELLGPGVALAKTGTSPHWDTTGETGPVADYLRTDGWCVALCPADEIRYLVIVYYPDGLGAGSAAPLAAQVLSWANTEKP